MSTDAQKPVLLAIEALSKSFASPVLKSLNVDILKGEVHALLGSNGAGKSTLCNIIAGIHQPTEGALRLEGQPYQPQNLKDAEKQGIRMVMQELSVFDNLSVAENICFKDFSASMGVIKNVDCEHRAKTLLDRLGQSTIDVSAPLSTLGVGQKQLVEIARVLDDNAKLLILDEPTAALTDPEIECLFEQVNVLREQGVSIIYISHRMDEIKRIADRVSVLRDGQLVATENAPTADTEALVEMMAGQAVKTDVEKQATQVLPCLELSDFSRAGYFRDLNISINKGEVLGIGGLMGAGRTEFLRCLYGADRADSGVLKWSGSDRQTQAYTSPKHALAAGIAMVVEDRKQQGLLLPEGVASNMGLAISDQFTGALGKFKRGLQHERCQPIANALAIKCENLDQPVAELSGGNQQKALIGRILMTDATVLLFDEPSRGVDANAKATIQKLIREQASKGKAVVVVSSETQELLNVSDRIIVMSNGLLADEFDASTVTEAELVAASFKYHVKAS